MVKPTSGPRNLIQALQDSVSLRVTLPIDGVKQKKVTIATTPFNWRQRGEALPVPPPMVCLKCHKSVSILHTLRYLGESGGYGRLGQSHVCHDCVPPAPFRLPRDAHGRLKLRFAPMWDVYGEPVKVWTADRDLGYFHKLHGIEEKELRLMDAPDDLPNSATLEIRFQP